MKNKEEVQAMMKEIETRADEVETLEGLYSLYFDDYYDITINGRVIPVSTLILTDTSLDVFGAPGFQRYEFIEIMDVEL